MTEHPETLEDVLRDIQQAADSGDHGHALDDYVPRLRAAIARTVPDPDYVQRCATATRNAINGDASLKLAWLGWVPEYLDRWVALPLRTLRGEHPTSPEADR